MSYSLIKIPMTVKIISGSRRLNGIIAPPTSWQLFKTFSGMLSVSEDKKSGLVSVSIEYYSPRIAKEWLDSYVASINSHMQSRQGGQGVQ
jgi:hypothetical protein